MDKESRYELQKIDCKFMQRDLEKYNSYNHAHKNSQGKVMHASHRPHYGLCTKFNKGVCFVPNVCQIETQECFIHRKDN